MRRLIIGGVALVTGAVTALGVAFGLRRRRGQRDEVLVLEPTSSVGATGATGAASASGEEPSIEADFGAVPMDAGPTSTTPKRRRPRRKPAGATPADASAATKAAADEGSATMPASANTAPAAKTTAAAAKSTTAAAKPRTRRRRKPAATSTATPDPSGDDPA